MSIRLVLRSVIVLGVAAAGIPTLATLVATPAGAFCLGFRCGGFGFHIGPSMFASRPIAPSLAMPASQLSRLHVPHNIPSTAAFHPKTALPNAGSSGTSQRGCPTCRRLAIPKQNNDVNPGGPSTFVSASPGGSGQGAAGGGNFTSGLAPGSSGGGGGGSGQFTPASAPGNGSATASRSFNDPAVASRSSTGGSAVTRSQAAPSTASTATLTAVTVCMTRAGSCPMERDVGSACQCKDTQGNIYDGVVR